MAETVIPVSGDVKGNITSCKIETQIKSVERGGAISLTERTTYITYDVCNKETLAEYTNSNISLFGGVIMCAVILGVVISGFFAWEL